jgi:hypothetical protein
MRLILGILIGIGITIGAAYVHDINLSSAPAGGSDAAQPAAGRPVVNWDVLSAITHDGTEWVRAQWNKLVH